MRRSVALLLGVSQSPAVYLRYFLTPCSSFSYCWGRSIILLACYYVLFFCTLSVGRGGWTTPSLDNILFLDALIIHFKAKVVRCAPSSNHYLRTYVTNRTLGEHIINFLQNVSCLNNGSASFILCQHSRPIWTHCLRLFTECLLAHSSMSS